MAEVMNTIQSNQYERELKNLIVMKSVKGRSAAIFDLRDKVLGKKKTQQDAVIIINPETGENVFTPKEIKSVSLKYCVDLLTNKEPKKEYEDVTKYKEYIHSERMLELVEDDMEELPVTTFNKVYNDVCRKSGNKYDFLVKAGNGLKEVLFVLMKSVWKTEKIPVKWQESTLIPVIKRKGKLGDLEDMRFLHDRNIFMKFFGLLVLHHAKEPIYRHMTKFQIACKPGHRASEHLYVLKSVFQHFKHKNKEILATSYDYKKFFDMENNIDCMNEL